MERGKTSLTCPSAQPDMEEARIFGVVAGTAEQPRVAYLKQDAEVGEELMQELGALKPTQVFRYAGRCEESKCAQYCEGRCSLGQRVAELLEPVTDDLPSCQIRASCRWYSEIGRPACLRCPQVITLVPAGEGELAKIALPQG